MDLTQGDYFERKHFEWIRLRLPHYEPVWQTYIGNDGNGFPCAIEGLTDDQNADRKTFYQAHYSFVPKMLAIHGIAKRLGTDFDRVEPADLHEATQELFNLMAAVGYVRDMWQKIGAALGRATSLSDKLQELYDERSHVLHGPRLPIITDDGFAKVPRVGGRNPRDTDWTDDRKWDEVEGMELVYLADFASDVRRRLFAIVNDVHGSVMYAAEKRFNGKRIEPDERAGSGSNPVSGSTGDDVTISGVRDGSALSASGPPPRPKRR